MMSRLHAHGGSTAVYDSEKQTTAAGRCDPPGGGRDDEMPTIA
jgi:hypothetical protein